MKQLHISCVKQIFEYATPVWYQKLTDQWKDKIQKVQNTALHKNLGAFKSTPAKPMKFDSEALPAKIRKKRVTNLPSELLDLWVQRIETR